MFRGWAGSAKALSPSTPSTAFRSNCPATRRPSSSILRRRTKACIRSGSSPFSVQSRPFPKPTPRPSFDTHPNDGRGVGFGKGRRSEEHTSELQSHLNLVCRLLLEKKKNNLHSGLLEAVGGPEHNDVG